MDRLLIVNADDYGRSPGVSKGIRQAHRFGLVSSTTVMINLPQAIEDLKAVKIETPELALGVHLNLTFGSPCSPISEVSSLVNKSGKFLSYHDWMNRRDNLRVDEIEREWRAQIERFLTVQPTFDHLDSHHHIAVFPEVWPVFLELAHEFNCGLRLPCPQSLLAGKPTGFLPPDVDRFACEVALQQLRGSDIPQTDFLRVDFFGDNVSRDNLVEILRSLHSGVSELMCHPGYIDDLLKTSRYLEEREQELRILTSNEVKDCIIEEGIEITSFKHLVNESW